MSQTNTDILYIEDDYFTPDGYYTYTALAASAQSSSFTLSAIIGNVKGADLVANNFASVSATASVIRNVSSSLSSSVTHATNANRIRESLTPYAYTWADVVEWDRFSGDSWLYNGTYVVANTSLSADLTEVLGQVVEASGSWSSAFTTNATALRIQSTSSSQSSAFTQTTTVIRSASLVSTQSSAFTQTCQINYITQGASAQSSAFTQTTTSLRIIDFAVALAGAFSPSMTVNAIRNSFAVLDSVASMSVDATANRAVNIALASAISQSLSGMRLAGLASAISAQFSISASADNRTKQGTASLSTTATVSATTSKLQPNTAALVSTSTFTAQVLNLGARPLQVSQSADASISTVQQKFGPASLLLNNGNVDYYASNRLIPSTTDDYYISAWVWPDNITTSRGIMTHGAGSLDTIVWRIYSERVGSTNRLTFESFSSSGLIGKIQSPTGFTNASWNHIAVSRKSGVYALWLNGTRQTTVNYGNPSVALNILGPEVYQFQRFRVGRATLTGSSIDNWLGYIDEVEMKIGTFGIYDTANSTYTQPASASANDETQTRFLFHYDVDFADDVSKQLSAALNSSATLTATATRTQTAASAITSSASLTASAVKTVQASAAISAQGFVVAVTGRIKSQLADLDTSFALTASVDVVVNFDCAMTSTCTLTATGLDIDFASAQLTTAVTLTSTATPTIRVAVALTSTATLTAQPDNVYLQLISGAGNTSGFITSTGTTIIQSFTDSGQAPEQYSYGWWPVHLNFWVKINTALSSGASVLLYTSGSSNTVHLRNVSGAYFIDVAILNLQSEQNNGFEDNYTRYNTTSTCRIPLGSNNPVTDFVNIDCRLIPFVNQTWRVDPSLLTSRAGLDWGSPKVNGTDVSESITTTNTELSTAPGFNPPTITAGSWAVGGQWGANTNSTDVYLDQVWVDNLGANTVPPVTDFIVSGQQANISANGTTASSLRAQVWLPWGNLLDRSNLAPTWNYTATNRVIPGIVKQGNAAVDSQFTQTIIFSRVAQGQAAVSAATTLTVPGRRVRFAQVSATSAFTQTTQATKAAVASANLSTSASQTTIIGKLVGVTCAMTCAFACTTQERRLRGMSSALTCEATTSATGKKFTGIGINASAEFTQITINRRIRDVNTQFNAIATEVTAAFKNATGTVLMESQVTFVAAVNVRPAIIDASLTAQVTVVVESRNVVRAQSSITSQVTMSTEATKFRLFAAALTTTASQTTQARKTARASANLTSTSTLIVNAVRVLQYASVLQSQATVTATFRRNRLGAANLTSQATVGAIITPVVRFDIALTSQGFVVTVGQIIHIDPFTTYMIPQETRNTQILAETRLYVINQETRVNTIIGSAL